MFRIIQIIMKKSNFVSAFVNSYRRLLTLFFGTLIISGFVATIIFIISAHLASSLLSKSAAASSFYAASKFINRTPTNKFMKKNAPMKTKMTKK
jgi:hypothetical protein